MENRSNSEETAVARQGGVIGRQTNGEEMWKCSRVRKWKLSFWKETQVCRILAKLSETDFITW